MKKTIPRLLTLGLPGMPPIIVAIAVAVSTTFLTFIYATLFSVALSVIIGRALIISEEKKLSRAAGKAETIISGLNREIDHLSFVKASNEKLLTSTDDIIVVVHQDGKIFHANRAMSGLLDMDIKEMAGHFLPDLAPPSERNRIKEFIAKAIADGSAAAVDLMLNNQNGGSSWFDGKAQLVDDKKQTFVQIVLRDITESKRQYVLTEKEISFIHELSRTLPLLQDFDQMLDRILGMLSNTLPFKAFALVLVESDEIIATICVGHKTSPEFLSEVRNCISGVLIELGDNIKPADVDYTIKRKSDIEAAVDNVNSQIILPLAVVDGIAGLFSDQVDAFKKEDLSLFSTMVSGISSLYIAYKSYKQVQHLSVTDPLTGLFNRRKFFDELEREVDRVSRYGAPMTMIMLDLDHFKLINDEYGHQMGDEVLRTLSEILKASTRKTDLVSRYGGEEFVIILTETPVEGAMGVANRIRGEVEKAIVLGAAVEIHFTVSLGLTYFQKGDTADTLIARADHALYKAKNNGRNRVELAEIKQCL